MVMIRFGYTDRSPTVDVDKFLCDIKDEYPEGFTSRQALEFVRKNYFWHTGSPCWFSEMSPILRQLIRWGKLKEIERLKTGKWGFIVYQVMK